MRKLCAAALCAVGLSLCPGAALGEIVLDYQGAFKVNCPYGGTSMAYYPEGNGGGGSIFVYSGGSGTWFCEYALDAALVITGDHAELNTATALIPKDTQTWGGGHPPAGMEYHNNRVYGGRHQPGDHGYTDVTGNAEPGYAGPWKLEHVDDRRVGDYLAAIPSAWVAANLAGTEPQGEPPAAERIMSTGYEWGPWGYGPDLYAYDPDSPYDNDDDPGTADRLPDTILLQYSSSDPQDGWVSGDEWNGAGWVEIGDDTYFLLTGKKLDGVGGSTATVQVYDADDLADVAAGIKQPWEPQPIQNISVQPRMFEQDALTGAAFDGATNTLYAVEDGVGGTSPAVHVWHVVPEPATLLLIGLGGAGALLGKRR